MSVCDVDGMIRDPSYCIMDFAERCGFKFLSAETSFWRDCDVCRDLEKVGGSKSVSGRRGFQRLPCQRASRRGWILDVITRWVL